MPTFLRRLRTSSSRISWPSKKTVPAGGSQRRLSARRSVDLPLPLGPMTPTITPFGMSTLSSFSMMAPPPSLLSDFLVRFRIRNFTSRSASPTLITSRCSPAAASSSFSSAHKKKKLNEEKPISSGKFSLYQNVTLYVMLLNR